MSIQRWGLNYHGYASPDGAYVTYADHLAALRQAEQRGLERGLAAKTVKKSRVVPSASASMTTPLADEFIERRQAYEQGHRDMLAKCIAAVEAWALENPHEHPSPNRIITALRALKEKKK